MTYRWRNSCACVEQISFFILSVSKIRKRRSSWGWKIIENLSRRETPWQSHSKTWELMTEIARPSRSFMGKTSFGQKLPNMGLKMAAAWSCSSVTCIFLEKRGQELGRWSLGGRRDGAKRHEWVWQQRIYSK